MSTSMATSPCGTNRCGAIRKRSGAAAASPLDPATVAVLRTVRTQQLQQRLLVGAAYVDHDLVFAWPDGRPYHPERFSRSFVRLVKRWGAATAVGTRPPPHMGDPRHAVGDSPEGRSG